MASLHPHPALVDAACTPLHSFQASLQAVASSRLGARLARLPGLAWPRSRLTQLAAAAGLGLGVLCWLLARPARRGPGPAPPRPPAPPHRKKRARLVSASSAWAETDSSASRPSYNWAELQKNSVSDQESVVSAATLVDGTQLAPQQLGLMGMEALETVIGYWEDALAAYNPTATRPVLTTNEETEFIRSLEDILEAAYDLQENSEMLFIHQNSVLNKRQPALVQQVEAGTEGRQRTKSVLSISTLEELSFVSAQDTVADLKDFDDLLEQDTGKLGLYQTALDVYETSGIEYRVLRTQFLSCSSDLEYLCKLHCLRSTFTLIMSDPTNRTWWMTSGRAILAQLLVRADKDPKDFFVAFDDMLEYLSEDGIEQQVMDELSSRNVKCMNFYDICLDYILIDSFEDLESPPSSVLAVMKNRWLSNSFKESALQTALWSVFQAKRRLLQSPNGFKSKFYNVSEILTPSLAWAFFGPDQELASLANEFKEQVLGFLRDLYSFQAADYTSLESLAQSVQALARARLDTVKRKLGCAQ